MSLVEIKCHFLSVYELHLLLPLQYLSVYLVSYERNLTGWDIYK